MRSRQVTQSVAEVGSRLQETRHTLPANVNKEAGKMLSAFPKLSSEDPAAKTIIPNDFSMNTLPTENESLWDSPESYIYLTSSNPISAGVVETTAPRPPDPGIISDFHFSYLQDDAYNTYG
jgi:hypothetical protein